MKTFKPDLSPHEMMKLGVFGGVYFLRRNKLRTSEYPHAWQTTMWKNQPKSLSDAKYCNFFKVLSGLSLEEWSRKGWIHRQDPFGWFQWYCRYYLGRRTLDDERQIKRHKAFIRHSKALLSQSKGDVTAFPVRRQALLQWGYDPLPDVKFLGKESIYQKCKRVRKNTLSTSKGKL